MYDNELPTPYELNDAPELAVLAVLETAIEASARALVALYPGLCDEEDPRSEREPVVRSAFRLLSRAHKLQDAVAHYRQDVVCQHLKKDSAPDDPDSRSPEAF